MLQTTLLGYSKQQAIEHTSTSPLTTTTMIIIIIIKQGGIDAKNTLTLTQVIIPTITFDSDVRLCPLGYRDARN